LEVSGLESPHAERLASSGPPRILYLAHHGLGDLVNALPALSSVRRAYPDAFLGVTLAAASFESIVAASGVDEAYVYRSRLTGSFHKGVPLSVRAADVRRMLDFVRALRAENFDWILGSHCVNPWLAAGLAKAIGARRLIGEGRGGVARWFFSRAIWPKPDVHCCDANLEIVRLLGIEPVERKPRLVVQGNERAWAQRWLRGRDVVGDIVVFHIGAGENRENKRWPAGNYLELAEALFAEHRLTAVFVGSEGEAVELQRLVARSRVPAFCAAGAATLAQTVALVDSARVVVGNDSGILHLAAALGKRGLALFGPTNPARWRPFGDTIEVLWNRPECSPCDRILPYGCGNPVCMTSLPVSSVLERIHALLGTRS
jgi:ADP-heptose:LPS heptosyltransferase